MLGDFIYSGEAGNAAYEYDASSKYSPPGKFEKFIKKILLFVAIFVCGSLVWIFGISPCMVPVKIDVQGISGYDKADVLGWAGIDGKATYISVNAKEAELRLAGYHLLESVKVIKRFPDKLSIFVEPRKAVAIVLARVNGRIRPVYFDRHGVAIKVGSGAGELAAPWLPVVSGVLDGSEAMALGMQLPAAYLPLFSRIGAISDDDPRIWQAISEIGVAKKANDLYDLVVYPIHETIRLRMRSDISKDGIYYALLMFDVYRNIGDSPYEIDVRSGLGVVKAKEDSFGR
jgi:cell division septal protein FtsQ